MDRAACTRAAYSAMLAALHSLVNCLGSRGSSHNCKKLPAPRTRPRVLGSGTFGCGTEAPGFTMIGATWVVVAVGTSTAWASTREAGRSASVRAAAAIAYFMATLPSCELSLGCPTGSERG